MPRTWEELLAIAEVEIKSLLDALPPELRKAIEHLPITCEPQPSCDPVYGLDQDLGLFRGEPLSEDVEIILYLENIWDLAEEDDAAYREEIRTTLLHELGHYLGLDEADLEQRGLL